MAPKSSKATRVRIACVLKVPLRARDWLDRAAVHIPDVPIFSWRDAASQVLMKDPCVVLSVSSFTNSWTTSSLSVPS